VTLRNWDDYQSVLQLEKMQSFKDAEKLKEYLKVFFTEWEPLDNLALDFKRYLQISDEVMRDALTGIVRESSARVGWIRDTSRSGDATVRRMIRTAIQWMWVCTDTETKKLLWDIAMDSAKDSGYRRVATIAYLRRADVDVQETKDFFKSLFADEARLPADHIAVFKYGIETVLKEKMDEKKREEIDAAYRVITAREKKE